MRERGEGTGLINEEIACYDSLAGNQSARDVMRVLAQWILRKYGSPPDLQDGAVQMVLQQAEALSVEWAGVA